jgi:two-component system nitrate/nitrite response regulator NarL
LSFRGEEWSVQGEVTVAAPGARVGVTSFLVVDGDAVFASSTRELLELGGYDVRTAASGEEALRIARELRPLVVITETHLPGVSGYELCRALREAFGNGVAIAFVSASRTEVADVSVGLLLGADDYLAKPCDPSELSARAGALLRRVRQTDRGRAGEGSRLTRRELEVLALLADGLTQREIARGLSISPSTVARHIEHVLSKLGVHSRAQAVAVAFRGGVLDAGVRELAVALRRGPADPSGGRPVSGAPVPVDRK